MANRKITPASLPSPTYTVPSNNKELRMSYGMYNDIMRLVGDPQSATQLLITDATTRDLVVRRLFTENNKSVTQTDELIDSFEIDILPSELDGIVAWVADHVAYFLLSTGTKMNEVVEKYRGLGEELAKAVSSNQSNDGSED